MGSADASTAEPRTTRLVGWRVAYLAVQGLSSVAVVVIVTAGAAAVAASQFLVAQGTVVAVQTVADLGVSAAAASWLAGARERMPERAADLTGALLAGVIRTALLATVAVALAAALFLGQPGIATTLLLCAPMAGCALVIAGLDGTLRTMNDLTTPVFLATASRLGMVAGVTIGVVAFDGSAAIAACASAATVLATLPAFARVWQLRAPQPVWLEHRREVLAACVPIGVSQLAVVLMARVTTPLTAAIAGVVVAGGFEAAWRLFQVGQYVLGGPLTALAPKIAREQERGEMSTLWRALGVAALLGTLCIPLTYVLATPAADLLAGDLAVPTANALQILALGFPFALVSLPAGFALAARRATDRWILAGSAGAGALVNVGITLAMNSTGWNAAVGPTAGLMLSGVLLTTAALRPWQPRAPRVKPSDADGTA